MTPCEAWPWLRVVRDYPAADCPREVKASLFVVATYADPDGSNVRPGNARIAADLGITEDRVGKHLQRGVALGLLDAVKRRHKSADGWMATVYQLTRPPALPAVDHAPAQGQTASPCVDAWSTVHPASTQGERPTADVDHASGVVDHAPVQGHLPTDTNPAVEEEVVDVTTDQRAHEAEPPPAPTAPVSAPLPLPVTAPHGIGSDGWPYSGKRCSACRGFLGRMRDCGGHEMCGPCEMQGVVFPTADEAAVS